MLGNPLPRVGASVTHTQYGTGVVNRVFNLSCTFIDSVGRAVVAFTSGKTYCVSISDLTWSSSDNQFDPQLYSLGQGPYNNSGGQPW